MTENKLELWTIGQSTRPIEELIEALRSFEIQLLADVRSYPGSKRYPQFNKENLKASLTEAAIDYQHFPELGGPPARPAGFAEPRMAQRIISRLCRLYGDRKFSRRYPAVARGGAREANGSDVLRSRLVALSSQFDL